MAATSRTASVGVNIALGVPGNISQSEGSKANGQIDPRQQHNLQPFKVGAIPILRATLDLLGTILGTYEAAKNKVAHVTAQWPPLTLPDDQETSILLGCHSIQKMSEKERWATLMNNGR